MDNHLKTYINGNLASNQSLGSFRFLDTCFGANVRIGVTWLSAPAWFSGKIDDVKIFSRALSASQVQQLYSRSFTQFANAGTDTSVCAGDSIRLTATRRYHSCLVSLSKASSDTTSQMPFVKPSQNRTYVLKATRGACADLDTVSVTYIPVGVNAGSDTSICPGKSVQLNATGTGVIGWRTSSALNDSTDF
jgi:hypothetical protein